MQKLGRFPQFLTLHTVSAWWAAASSAFLSAALPVSGWAQGPAGSEFRVNNYTTYDQSIPGVASDANGNFVVVWQSDRQDGDLYGVFGKRFNAAGAVQGTEFQVNSFTTSQQWNPGVASDANGNFVVVWQSFGQDGDRFDVFGKRFNAAGAVQGTEFRVNTYTKGYQSLPAVASNANGNFVVVWQSYSYVNGIGQDGSYRGIFGQRFNAAGAVQGTEFQVNSYTTVSQARPGVASDANGNFVVVWQSYYQDGGNWGVFGQRFSATGAVQGTEFQVNSYTTSFQYHPGVASDANGNFVVVWDSFGQDGSYRGVFGKRFNAAGAVQGTEFQINSYTTASQSYPRVASDPNGNFVVVWQSFSQDGSTYGVFGQRFSAAGMPQGTEFAVNSYTPAFQGAAAIASDPDGDFVVSWLSTGGQDGSANGVFGQRYGDLIFEDGFESGDLTRWTTVTTDGFDLSVSGAAAMAGTSGGMAAFVNDTNPLFVQDDTPNAESRYRVRFYFDPNGFDTGEASSHFRTRIFIAFDSLSQRTITIVLKRLSGQHSIGARLRLDDGTRANTGFFNITDGPHFIEFDWIRASAPGANDGIFTLRIDDSVDSTITTLNDDVSSIDFARLGALSIKTGAAGTLFFDQFESRRQRFIGPE